jgi:hypothetical protein
VAGKHQRSLPALRQWPWPCDHGAMNGSLFCPIACKIFHCGIKADVATLEDIKHGIFVKTSITSRLGITMNSRCNIGATSLIWGRGPDQGQERSKEPPPRNPAISIYRFRALKVSHGRNHHGIVTKTQTNDGCHGRRGPGGRRDRSECIRTRRTTSNWHRVIDQA